MSKTPDIVIIGSGIGGSTVAAGLAGTGAEILILEAGGHIEDRPENRDQRAIFQRGHFRPKEIWYELDGVGFNPGNYYNVGGNSKFYGAVLARYRREDFGEIRHREGVSPAWPFSYEELEPWYGRAERMYRDGPDHFVSSSGKITTVYSRASSLPAAVTLPLTSVILSVRMICASL